MTNIEIAGAIHDAIAREKSKHRDLCAALANASTAAVFAIEHGTHEEKAVALGAAADAEFELMGDCPIWGPVCREQGIADDEP